jgi:hypothetical protein
MARYVIRQVEVRLPWDDVMFAVWDTELRRYASAPDLKLTYWWETAVEWAKAQNEEKV